MSHRIVVNVTEHDAMYVRLLRLVNVEEVAAAGTREITLALIWECTDNVSAEAQAQVLWNENIPARITNLDSEEINMVNLIIETASRGEVF